MCPACEEPSGLGEEIIFAEDVCNGNCEGGDVVGTTTRLMTQAEVENPDFDCLTPGCVNVVSPLSPEEEEAEVQGARDHAKRFLREKHESCLSLCILPFYESPPRPEFQVRPSWGWCMGLMDCENADTSTERNSLSLILTRSRCLLLRPRSRHPDMVEDRTDLGQRYVVGAPNGQMAILHLG